MDDARTLTTGRSRPGGPRSTTARAIAALGLLGALTTGCLNVISTDPALADEYARFKETGGECTGAGGPVQTDAEYASLKRYRWVAYGGVLGEVVSDDGQVYYDELLGSSELMDNARRTIAQIASVQPESLEGYAEKMAFWINAYNALVLVAAADGYAEDPAFRVDAGSGDFSFFDRREHTVGGVTFSLNEIEHGVIRGAELHPSVYFLPDEEKEALLSLHRDLWGEREVEPRFHFAINCASSSCPPLTDFQVRAADLDETLDELTSAFLHDEEVGAGPDGVSQLFDFYYDDFEAVGGAEAFIRQYRDWEGDEVNTATYLPYDWSLNRAEVPADDEVGAGAE